jgi:septum formation protein
MSLPPATVKPMVCLASASPRRTQLLEQMGIPHVIVPADIDESRLTGESPAQYVVRLAVSKGRVVWEQNGSASLPVLAADTTVALGNEIFGKPRDRDEGIAMLGQLSGRTHQVLTAVALYSLQGCDTRLSVSEVTFGTLSKEDCAAYWGTGEPQGKAGGYAIQGRAAAFISHISGSHSGIMGLPLFETVEMLKKALGCRF